jgi:glycosyltransferase involved in cell wall biosynthesis
VPGEATDALRALLVHEGALARLPLLVFAATTLRDAGWDVSVAAPMGPMLDGVTWYPRPRARGSARRHLRRTMALADVVLTDVASFPLVRRARGQAPVVLLADEPPFGRAGARLVAYDVALAVASSEVAAATLRWRGIETMVLATTTAPGADAPIAAPAGADVVGCATRFDPGAGLDVLLDAFARLRRPGVRLELVDVDGGADPRFVAALRARAARPDLDGRVEFLAPPADHHARMRAWRVAVAAPVATAAPLGPLRDAMADGIPVVVSDRLVDADVVGDHGIVVRPGRSDALARAIVSALDDTELRARAAAAARARRGDAVGARRSSTEFLHAVTAIGERGARRRGGSIVFVVPDFEPTLGGTTRQTQNQALELCRRGHDVVVLTQQLEMHWPRAESRGAVRIRRVGPPGRTVVRMKLLVLSVAWWLRRHRDEIAIVNPIMYPDFVVSAALAGLGDRTVMCWAGLGDATDTIGTSAVVRAPLRAVRRRALGRAAQVALTPALREELDRVALGRDVTIIPTPVDLDAFRPPNASERGESRHALGVRDDEFVIAYTGHLRALKRVERLVAAFGLLVASGRPARLLLVGSSREDLVDDPDALRSALDRFPAREHVIITGAVGDVRPYLYAADVFVLPSDREGLSNSMLEALASGLPVVAPASAAGDQVLDASCGVVPRSNDPVDLFVALRELAERPEYRAELAAGARRAAERFALARVVNEYEDLYARLRERDAVR